MIIDLIHRQGAEAFKRGQNVCDNPYDASDWRTCEASGRWLLGMMSALAAADPYEMRRIALLQYDMGAASTLNSIFNGRS